MSEWLTTGQMIDQLKDGEVAESIDGEYEAYWHNGLLEFRDRHGDVQETIIKSDQKRKWRILPKYVSFEEAYEAGKQGKVVNFHYKDGMVHRIEHFDDSLDENGLSCYCLRELIEGDWSIED
jgi:hypothetical protein